MNFCKKGKMNQDIVNLILGYKSDLDKTQKCIDLMNDRYNSIIDLKFLKYEHVAMFVERSRRRAECCRVAFKGRTNTSQNGGAGSEAGGVWLFW